MPSGKWNKEEKIESELQTLQLQVRYRDIVCLIPLVP